MRTATTVEASGLQRWSDQRDFVVEAEKNSHRSIKQG